MDPQACWNRIKEDIKAASNDQDDRGTTADRLRDLAEWLERGGFYPKP